MVVVTAGYAQNMGEEQQEVLPLAQIDEKPSFMGGDATTFSLWMFKQIVYPIEARDKGEMGRVAVEFVITKEGKVKDVKLAKSSGSKSLDAEALRVISLSPDWQPGKVKGEAVNVRFLMPVVFELRGPSTKKINIDSLLKADGCLSYSQVDPKPRFLERDTTNMAFSEWVFGELKYPQEAYKNGAEGRVIIRFVISKTGKVRDVEVLKGTGNDLLDKEAVRVISSSPAWASPGIYKGEPIDVKFVFPVVFKLK